MRRASSGVFIACTLLLGACSSGADQSASSPVSPTPAASTASPSPDPLLTPAASPVLDAVALSRAAGSAAIEVQSTATVASAQPWLNIGTGSVDLAKGLGRIAFESSNGGTSELLVNQDGNFVSTDGGKTWFLLDFQQMTPLLGAVNVFRLLSNVEWSEGEQETVDGQQLTRYDGTVVAPTIADAIDGMGISTEDPTALVGAQDLYIDISVWVDDAGRIVRVLRVVTAQTPDGPLDATELTTLSDFGSALDLTSPDPAQVQPAPEN